MIDVPNVQHEALIPRESIPSIHLCPSGDSGPYFVTAHLLRLNSDRGIPSDVGAALHGSSLHESRSIDLAVDRGWGDEGRIPGE